MRFPRSRRKRRFDEDSGDDDNLRQLLIQIVEDADPVTLRKIAAACDLDSPGFDDAAAVDDTTDRDRVAASAYREGYVRRFSESAGRKIAEDYYDVFGEQLKQAGFSRAQFIHDFRSLTPRHRDEMTAEYQKHLGGR